MPGCGDYAILSAMQRAMPDLGIPREDIVLLWHRLFEPVPVLNDRTASTRPGRAPARRPGSSWPAKLKVFVIRGDGDGLSIGGNHLLHVCGGTWDVTILLSTTGSTGDEGQYSPNRASSARSRSRRPWARRTAGEPVRLGLAAGATYVSAQDDRSIGHMERRSGERPPTRARPSSRSAELQRVQTTSRGTSSTTRNPRCR